MTDIGSNTSPEVPVYEYDDDRLEITLEIIDEYREALAYRLEAECYPSIAQEVLKWTDEETLEVGTLNHWFFYEVMKGLTEGKEKEECEDWEIEEEELEDEEWEDVYF